MSKRRISKKQAKEQVTKGAEKVTMEDLDDVLNRKEELRSKFASEGPLRRFIEDFKLLLAITKDYFNGNYKEVPFWSMAAIVAALLYILRPVDLIPDFMPVIEVLMRLVLFSASLLSIMAGGTIWILSDLHGRMHGSQAAHDAPALHSPDRASDD